MSRGFIGNSISGNFKFSGDEKPSSINNAFVEKIDNYLTLKIDAKIYRLIPADLNANTVEIEFDDGLGEENASIYDLTLNGNILTIILYTYYGKPKKLLGDNNHLYIYVDRITESDIILNPDKYDLPKKGTLLDFLNDEFVVNKSIFMGNGKRGMYSLEGKHHTAKLYNERPGVFSLNKITKRRNSDIKYDLYQIFGNVHFVSIDEAISISSSRSSTFTGEIETSQVFDAWGEYIAFKDEVCKEEQSKVGIIRFNASNISSETITFTFDEQTDIADIFKKENKYEVIFSNGLPVPNNIDEVWEFNNSNDKENYSRKFDLCAPLNINASSNQVTFKLPDRYMLSYNPESSGIIYLSIREFEKEKNRREGTLSTIRSKKNITSNLLMTLSDKNVVDKRVGRNDEPINAEVLSVMFPNEPDTRVSENFHKAMHIALNTPDVALIQGPPGAGKTTLINGLITRIKQRNKNFKILVSSEQHEALYNVITKLIKSKYIPPHIASRRYFEEEDDDSLENTETVNDNTIAEAFQDAWRECCDSISKQYNSSAISSNKMIADIAFIFNRIKESNYSPNVIRENIDAIKSKLLDMGCYSYFESNFKEINSNLYHYEHPSEETDPTKELIVNKIKSQRLSTKAFLDDGEYQLNQLCSKLLIFGYNDCLIDTNLKDKLLSKDSKVIESAMNDFNDYVQSLESKFIHRVRNEFEEDKPSNIRILLDTFYDKFAVYIKGKDKTIEDIADELRFKLSDLDNVKSIIGKYTSVIGSTCAQAKKTVKWLAEEGAKYDYVIIDEAARANPVDLMIPILMGSIVILIGDQNQLPHYIETEVVEMFAQNNAYSQKFNKELLMKSYFQIMFDNLEKAYVEKRIDFERTIRLDTQYRMNPLLSEFVSSEFYDSKLKYGEKTKGKINDYGICDGKNIAFLNIDPLKVNEREENKYEHRLDNGSYKRESESERVVKIINQLIEKNNEKQLDIGVISFYKEQVDDIKEKVKKKVTDSVARSLINNINTVDSFQGKEFDIVILSCVRSNTEESPKKALGFIHQCSSRVNVAFSRAKRLLIVIGDERTLKKTKHFKSYIDYVKENGYYGK